MPLLRLNEPTTAAKYYDNENIYLMGKKIFK